MTKNQFLKIHSPRIIGILFLGFFTLHFFIRTKDHLLQYIPLKCPSYFFFSIKCPLCGLGHAVLEANRFHFEASFNHHPLGIAVYIYLILISLGLLILPDKIKTLHLFLLKKKP